MTTGTDNISLPRRTIEELIARYELEPELRDLFVEGPSDRIIYSWYLRKCGYKQVGVFEIDSVDIPRELLDTYDLHTGNRSRVIVLALELDRNFTSMLEHVRCIADSDFDFILDIHHYSGHLIYTDYTSVDMYTYKEELLNKLLCLAFDHSDNQARSVFVSMTSVLRQLFIIRAVNKKLDWGMTFPRFTRCCRVRNSKIIFNRGEFVNRSLSSNQRQKKADLFGKLYDTLETVMLSDIRKSIHGDDYFELLGWYLHCEKNWRGYSKDQRSAMKLLLATLEERDLANETMFLQLGSVFRNR